MACRIAELRDKQVVCVRDGTILGLVNDVEVDVETGSLVAIIIYARSRLLPVRRDDDIVIPWSQIEIIGNDTVLVNYELPEHFKKHKREYIKFR